MGELYRLYDVYRTKGTAFSDAGSEAERSASRAQGLWVIIGALILLLAVVGVFSLGGARCLEEAVNGPTNLHVALTQAER
jgi:hypothetical protein